MDIRLASTLETKEMNSTDEHESFSFETPHVSCSLLESPGVVLLKTTCPYEDPNLLLILVHKLFRGWLWMLTFITNFANLVAARSY